MKVTRLRIKYFASRPDPMQSPPPQVPSQHAQQPGYQKLKRGALFVLLAAMVVVVAIAFLLPKRQVESRNAPTSTQHRVTSPGYSNPTQSH